MFFFKKSIVFALAVPAAIFFLDSISSKNAPIRFHSGAEKAFFRKNLKNLSGPELGAIPIDSSIWFPSAAVCGGCHGGDTNKLAFIVPSTGEDVNIYDAWRSSVMANSAKDPFWRAKVEHESLVNPAHAAEIQDKCVSCHAPTGHYQAFFKEKKAHYGLAELLADSIGLDGVNCQGCHAQDAFNIGSRHSGALVLDTNRVTYGPYEQIFLQPMLNFVGVTPKYGDQILDAGLCATCHTLITESFNLDNTPSGKTFIEQATYHEWLNSAYNDNGTSCQSCHLPQINEPIVISANYGALPPKKPFGRHSLAGANTVILDVMKKNRAALGIDATEANFDSTIAATRRMLQQKTLDLSIKTGVLAGDTAFFTLTLKNRAGHKFPSGYPSRRAVVQFFLIHESGDTLFASGLFEPDFSLKNEATDAVLPHFDVIRSPLETQVYEMAAGDQAGKFTTLLERSQVVLKDNRLPPVGFSTADARYDTTRIVGAAEADKNFNRNAAGQGTGADELHFHVPTKGQKGKFRAEARVVYQSLPPKWLREIFSFSGGHIDAWRTMYWAADRSPVVVAEAKLEGLEISSVSTKNRRKERLEIDLFPSPTDDGKVFLSNPKSLKINELRVFSADGRTLFSAQKPTENEPIRLPEAAGVYLVLVETERGRATRKIVRR